MKSKLKGNNSSLVWNGNCSNMSEKLLFSFLSLFMYFRVKLDWIRFGGLLYFLILTTDYILVTEKYSNTDSLSSQGEMDINQLVWTELCVPPKPNLFQKSGLQAVFLLQTRKARASSHVIFSCLFLHIKVYVSRAQTALVRRGMLSTALTPLIWTLVGDTFSKQV